MDMVWLPYFGEQIPYGLTLTDLDQWIGTYVAQMEMHSEPHPPHGLSLGNSETVLFNVVLHEICHAYLSLYVCCGEVCQGSDNECILLCIPVSSNYKATARRGENYAQSYTRRCRDGATSGYGDQIWRSGDFFSYKVFDGC